MPEEPTRNAETSAYAGPERRRHRVYVTRNTEYHFKDGLCIAVRSRRTGEFVPGHLALQGRIDAMLRENGGIALATAEPRAGESLYFASGGRDLVTSRLESVGRPRPEIVGAYPGTNEE
jgi:hypothetical protein